MMTIKVITTAAMELEVPESVARKYAQALPQGDGPTNIKLLREVLQSLSEQANRAAANLEWDGWETSDTHWEMTS